MGVECGGTRELEKEPSMTASWMKDLGQAQKWLLEVPGT